MEVVVIFFIPIIAGIALSCLLCFIHGHRPTVLPWPTLVFAALLGGAANNVSAVWFAWADTVLPSSGGFFGGSNWDAAFTGLFLALFALSGLVVCLFLCRRGTGVPHALSGWGWSWVLTQAALSGCIFLAGSFLPFAAFSENPGLPLWGYLVLICLLCVALGVLFGWRWGRDRGVAVPLIGCGALCLVSAALAALMLLQSTIDATWGSDLIQSPAGMWYARLCLPSAVLLGDYQYTWNITPVSLYAFTLAPHLLFTAGYLAPKLFKRGK